MFYKYVTNKQKALILKEGKTKRGHRKALSAQTRTY